MKEDGEEPSSFFAEWGQGDFRNAPLRPPLHSPITPNDTGEVSPMPPRGGTGLDKEQMLVFIG